jgi:phage terminase large subunit-like protein
MQDSIVHQVVKANRGEVDEGNTWVAEERITARHWMPITLDADGQSVSVWPAKWSLDFLLSIVHTRGYAKNYANDPLGADGDYWTLDDITKARRLGKELMLGRERGTRHPGMTRVLVEVDPAVTTKKKSDYTGIAVIGWIPPKRRGDTDAALDTLKPGHQPPGRGRVVVLEVRQVKKVGEALRLDVLATVERHNAGLVRVESNQGGDLWHAIFWGMPVPVKTHPAGVGSKEERAAETLDHYQRGRVAHADGADLRDYEGQLVAFPRAPHDDMVDAGGAGIRYFLTPRKTKAKAGGEVVGYAA